jgi:cellulose synthase/poly-beta-1,6-N-acetylglucosamine synthase-like glycosyltransferase
MLLIGFAVAAAVLWASVFGYVALLLGLAVRARRRRIRRPLAGWPRVALVIPVRNEEAFIADKLADAQRTDYPSDRLGIIVVDGGSTDRTVALVEAARAGGAPVALVRIDGARGKADQLNAVLPALADDVIVVTDADTALDPSCVRRLVEVLADDPATGVVGARVRPASRLLEERVHWWAVNSLWWLEGEALGAGAVSGVCYAMRREAVGRYPSDCSAEDIHLALAANARGWRVRQSRRAVATELRVPQTLREFLRFRRRRGVGYARELLRRHPPGAPAHWHVLRMLRLAHFSVTPLVGTALIGAGAALCATEQWRWAVAAAAMFAVPAVAALAASTTLSSGRRWWQLGLAVGRLAGLTWLALLALPRTARPPIVQGD